MNIIEISLRVTAALRPMIPGLLTAVAATLAVLTVLMIFTRNVWVRDRRFHITGLFFGLSRAGSLKLACSWLKLIFVIVFIVGFQMLTLLQYMMLLIPGLLGALSGKGLGKGLGDLMWLALQLMGLVSTNLICGYIHEMAGGFAFILLYIVMGAFLSLFSIYLFLNEINTISASREVSAEEIWKGKQYETEN